MKKQFIFILASFFTMLFAACSQENELDAPGGEKSNLVSVSTQLPADFAKTRALPGAADHQLRCILEVWSTGENVKLISRHEKLADADADKISFTFEVEPATYNCLMWADFVASGATATEKAKGSVTYQGYEDKFYTTDKLDAVVVKDVNTLFNTEACDAFFGTKELVKEATAATLAASLTRPFAKLTIKEKDAESYAKCTSLTVGYKVPNTFNVKRNTVSGEVDAAYTGAPAGNSVYFTHYILASDETLGNIPMSFITDGQTVEKTIPAGVPIKRNYRTNASGNFIPKIAKPSEATVDISIGSDWLDDNQDTPVNPGTPEIAPVVGDYYYADGTYTATYTADPSNPCIGIVFAVGAGVDDAVGNYGSKLSTIKGYVLAVKDAAGVAAWGNAAITEIIEGTSSSDKDYLGYKNSVAIKGVLGEDEYKAKYFAAYACSSFTGLTAPNATSGWYLPSIGQLADIATLYYTPAKGETPAADGILKTNLAKLGAAGQLMQDNGTNGNYWSSTVAATFKLFRMQFFPGNSTIEYGKKGGTNATTNDTFTRAILTF